MNSWQQIMAAYPLLQTVWDALIIMIPLAVLIAYAGIFFLSATARIISITRKRSAYNKCSIQIAILGLIFGWTLLVGSRVWLYYTQHLHPVGTLETFLLEMSWLFLSIGVLLSSIYFFLRNVLKNMPILHVTLGMISAVQNCISLLIILFTIRFSSTSVTIEANKLALPELFPSNWDDPLWSALCYVLLLVLSLPAAFSSCWLVLRRKRDDFGRDYYNSMLGWCCSWARNAWMSLWCLLLVSTGIQVWQQMQNGIFNTQDAIIDNARILIWLLPPVFWTFVKSSAVPLRQSWLLFVALTGACFFMLPFYLQLTSI